MQKTLGTSTSLYSTSKLTAYESEIGYRTITMGILKSELDSWKVPNKFGSEMHNLISQQIRGTAS